MIGVTLPTLILPPTLDIFIFSWGEKIEVKAFSWIKIGKPQNRQLYVRKKVKMCSSAILVCGYGLYVCRYSEIIHITWTNYFFKNLTYLPQFFFYVTPIKHFFFRRNFPNLNRSIKFSENLNYKAKNIGMLLCPSNSNIPTGLF